MTTQIGQFIPVNLFAGEMYRSTKGVNLLAGQVYPVGSVIALNADKKGVLADSSGDTLTFYGVLSEEVDATEEDKVSIVYLTGEFNRRALVFGGADTADQYEEIARTQGIFFLDTEANWNE
ncbi:head decoration protein [Providencia huashanensis]|uniref:head decoration protein n=1 Tax=Providencia huashanensis TaxID=3037798 RepID=UPI002AFF7687|nr:head decoration protein [Providencia sp. 23021821]